MFDPRGEFEQPGHSIPPIDTADIKAPDAIIDSGAFMAALDKIAAERGSRRELLRCSRQVLEHGRIEIRRRFLDELGSGDDCVTETAYLADTIIRGLASVVADRLYPAPNPTLGERFVIVATGGYGRAELAPYSDIDLLFLLPYKRAARVEQVVEALLYLLWDLGFKVGHAVRSQAECLRQAKADMTIRTSLVEARPIWGDAGLYEDLRQHFVSEVVTGSGPVFVEAKLRERDERHRRLGDSRYVLEPHIKDGKGGLRDLQTLFWIGKYLYQVDDAAGLVDAGMLTQKEAEKFARTRSFLRTLRCHLHYLTGRAEERLTFDLQPEIGRRMGYTDHAGTLGVERLMKHYFLIAKDVGDLTRIFCAALEAESQRAASGSGAARRQRLFGRNKEEEEERDGFRLEGGRLSTIHDRQFRERPIDMIRLFHLADSRDLQIHPHALKLVTRALRYIGPKLRRDPEANRLFLDILTSRRRPDQTLRRMNEAGVLGRFIPDFGRVVAQMQHDMYHAFTVDEHTLFAIGVLAQLEKGNLSDSLLLATDLIKKIKSRRALYVAMLTHDIAKGRGGDHSVLGARVAAKLGPRLGLDDEESETAEWLVRHHLMMSEAAMKRDIEDDKTVADFATAVESVERLRLLLVLTTADIAAVGPGRLSGWKTTLLSQLYHRTHDLLSGALDGQDGEDRLRVAKAAIRDGPLSHWPDAEVETFLSRGYPSYWLSFDPKTHARHAALLRDADLEGRLVTVDTQVDHDRAVTEVTVLAPDHAGLFSRLAGALAVGGADIVEARIFTLSDGTALDVFTVQDAASGEALEEPEKLERLSTLITRSVEGTLHPGKEIIRRRGAPSRRSRAFQVKPRVLIDNDVSRTHTVVEVNGRNRPGLLYDLTRAFTEINIQIASAKISTFGARAVDVFYVKDLFGLKVTHKAKLGRIREVLLDAMSETETLVPVAPPVRPQPTVSGQTAISGNSTSAAS